MYFKILLTTLLLSLVASLFLKDKRSVETFLILFVLTFFLPAFKTWFKGVVNLYLEMGYTLYWFMFMSHLNLIMCLYFRKTNFTTRNVLCVITLTQSVVYLLAVFEYVVPETFGFKGFDLFYNVIQHRFVLTILSFVEVVLLWVSYGKRTDTDTDLGYVASKASDRRNKGLHNWT